MAALVNALLVVVSLGLVLSQSQEFKFIGIGDWGDEVEDQLPVAYAMARWADVNQPEFIVSTGDNFYPDGVRSVTDPKWTLNWVDVYTNASIVNLPWYISVGNHDYFLSPPDIRGDEWNQVDYHYEVNARWYLPHLWYSVTKQVGTEEVLLVSIDTVASRQNRNNHTEQIEWLEDLLATSTAKWKIVFGHFPCYSAGEYGPTQPDMINVFLPLFERYSVDFYLSGHDHNLQHISQIGDGGIDHVVSGSAGRGLYEFIPRNERQLNETYGMEVNAFFAEWGFTTWHVTESAITVQLINSTDHVRHTVVRSK